MRFFLGTHRPNWLAATAVPLFVSDRRLRRYKTLPVARGQWALDSGGFTELQKFGRWTVPAREYAARVRRYRDETGGLLWAAPQDRMCERVVIEGGTAGGQHFVGTRRFLDPGHRLTTAELVAEHQRLTVANLLELRMIAPDLPFIAVLQGWTKEDYLRCARLYRDAGVDLAAEPLVGIGSVCRRQGTREAAQIIAAVCAAVPGIRLHGFGIKTSGLSCYGTLLASSDSMAWSAAARRAGEPLCGQPHPRGAKNCANCQAWAFLWREHVLASLAGHATRTVTRRTAPVSIKLDSSHAQRLALAGFRDEAARLERDHAIRAAHAVGGMSVRAIADLTGLSPSRVGQVIARPAPPLLDQLRVLRARWGVDADPATRAAADIIIANATAAAMDPGSTQEGPPGRDSQSPLLDVA